MQALVVYESMFGNTHVVADHIAEGLRGAYDVTVVSVDKVDDATAEAADLLVVGGPTHAHGMTSGATRKSAADVAAKAESGLTLEPDIGESGLREWLRHASGGRRAAAFDTRVQGPRALTGSAAKGIARRLRHHGFDLVAEPESFFVDKDNHLVEGEAERATTWGASLVASTDAAR